MIRYRGCEGGQSSKDNAQVRALAAGRVTVSTRGTQGNARLEGWRRMVTVLSGNVLLCCVCRAS